MGFLGGITDTLGLTSGKQRKGANAYNQQMLTLANDLKASYAKARPELEAGFGKAMESAKSGFQTARGDTTSGFNTARQQYSTDTGKALDTAKAGFGEAKAFYDAPEMVSSRQELYNRVLGKGGLSPETVNEQKAGAIEDYGTALRGAEQSLNQFYGGSQASGLAGENLARAASSLGAERAKTVRDIDIGNEQLKRQEMTGAIGSLQAEAGARAGLSSQEAQYISGLEEKIASGTASLTTDETNALSQLAAAEGTTLADLQARLASGQAGLTTEEAKAIAEIMSQGAAAKLQYSQQPGALAGAAGSALGTAGAAAIMCWVAREVYGQHNPKWKIFQKWVKNEAPRWFVKLYVRYGPSFAKYISNKPKIKRIIRKMMDRVVDRRMKNG